MKTMTRAITAKVVSDWQREFPDLGLVPPRRLLRRVGPILEGILLEVKSDRTVYEPIFHVYCLATAEESPSISLTLYQQLRNLRNGAPQAIKAMSHEAKYVEAASRLRSQVPLSLTGPLKLVDVLAAYRAYLALPGMAWSAYLLFDDMIRICGWAGDLQQAHALIAEGLELLKQDPPDERVGGVDQWHKNALAAISSVAQLRALADAQAKLLGVAGLPSFDLL